jgi:hypothetical protein
LETNTTKVQRDLQMIELTVRANTYDNRPTERPSNRDRYTRQKTVRSKPPHAANIALQSSKYKKIKCWGFSHSHHLRNCPTTSEKERQRLWEKHRNRQPHYTPRKTHQDNTNRGSFNNSNNNNNKRNHSFPTVHAPDNVQRNSGDASSRTDDATAPSTAFAAKTQQLTMKRRNNGGLAFATTHQAMSSHNTYLSTPPHKRIQPLSMKTVVKGQHAFQFGSSTVVAPHIRPTVLKTSSDLWNLSKRSLK